MIEYFETGVLLQDDQDAMLSSGQYTMEDDMLRRMGHRGWFPQSIRGSACLQKPIGDAKVHYWWVGMMRDITKGCIVCVTRSVGRAVKPPPRLPFLWSAHSTGSAWMCSSSPRPAAATTMQLSLWTT